jgi:hypothetical protein
MISFAGALGEARLPHKNEACKQDSFEGHDRIEHGEGWGVEMMGMADVSRVYEDSDNEDSNMDKDESEVACKALRRHQSCPRVNVSHKTPARASLLSLCVLGHGWVFA